MDSALIPQIIKPDDPIVAEPVTQSGEPPLAHRASSGLQSLSIAISSVVAIALASIVTNTYLFGVSDHDDELPVIQHMLEPSLFKNDWFVQLSAKLNPRMAYDWLMAGLSWLLGIDGAYLLLHVACTTLLALAIFALTQRLSPNFGIGAGIIAVTIALFNRAGALGDSQLISILFVPAFLAFTIMAWAAFLLLSGRYYLAALLIAVTGALHVLIGPEAGGLFIFALVMSTHGAARARLLRVLPVLLAAVTVGFLLGYFMKTGSSAPVDEAELIYLYAWQRAPWHLLPASWPADWWLGFVAFMALVIAARFRSGRVPFLDWLIVGVAAFCLLDSVGFIFEPLVSTIVLQPFRMVVLIQLAGAIYIGRYCWLLFNRAGFLRSPQVLCGVALVAALAFDGRTDASYIWIVVASVLLAEVVVMLGERGYISTRVVPIAWVVAAAVIFEQIVFVGASGVIAWHTQLIVCCLAVLLLATWALVTHKYGSIALAGNVIALAAAGAVILIAWIDPRAPQPMASIQSHMNYSGGLALTELWARDHSPRDAVFVVPPYDDTFRAHAERAIVVDFKGHPFENGDKFDWRQRIYDVAGGKPLPLGWDYYDQLVAGYDSMTDNQLLTLGHKYGASYAVVSARSKSKLPVIYSNTQWSVRQLEAP